MVSTHLSRAGTASLRIKVDLEAAILSAYGGHNAGAPCSAQKDVARSITRLRSRLKRILSGGKNPELTTSLIHGYMFDAWSLRICADEFLALSVPWRLSTDSYLQLTGDLRMQDELAGTLWTLTDQESQRHMRTLLSSLSLSSKVLSSLFFWTVDQISTKFCLEEESQDMALILKDCSILVEIWESALRKHEWCRDVFWTCLPRLIATLLARYSRGARNDPAAKADEIIQGFVSEVVKQLQQEIGSSLTESPEHTVALQQWLGYLQGKGSSSDEGDIPRPTKKLRIDKVTSESRDGWLQERLRQDQMHVISGAKGQRPPQQAPNVYDTHQKAFIKICETIQKIQDYPGCPPRDLLIISRTPAFASTRETALKDHCMWVESTIASRSAGWQSCIKLKLQFYAVFEESTINESFAEQICTYHLYWELCSTLEKYLRRHRADSTRMPQTTFQLGCELLLSVFSKMEKLRTLLRDHLYQISSAICMDARAPLFGSFDFWKLNVEGLLTSTLNQIVVSENSSSVPPQTIDALIKISLVAPYHVVSKIIHSTAVNKGQSPLFLQLLLSLGQLVWLRPSAEEPTLFLLVISDIINSRAHKWNVSEKGAPWTTAQLDNFARTVEEAMSTRSRSGVVLLDPVDFLTHCAIPLLDEMELAIDDGSRGSFFEVVTRVIQAIYQPDSAAMATYNDWFSHDTHFELLTALLRLQTLKSPWSLNRLISERISSTAPPRRGGQHLESISNICEAVVARLTSAIETCDKTMDIEQQDRLSKFLAFVLRNGSMNVESKLGVAPLMLACRRHLAMELEIPELPVEISILFKRPLWQFRCKEVKTLDKSDVPAVLGLMAAFDIGRMCDELMQDIGQAIAAQSASTSDMGLNKAILVAVLYRFLSICTRSQSHRLFVKGVTAVMDMLGGIGLDDIAIFEQTSKEESTVAQIGSYWNEYIKSAKELGGKTVLAMLLVSCPLLQLALNPLPDQYRDEFIQVYQYGLGFDVLVDQVSSLIQSSIKSAIVDWSSMPLDLVLFSFMVVCKMSHTLATWKPDRAKILRVDPDSVINWNKVQVHARRSSQQLSSSTVSDLGPDLVNYVEQESVAQAKARDELVLMAMNFSEEVVRRQDEHYQLEVLWDMEQNKKKMRPIAAGRGRGKRQRHGFDRNAQARNGGDVVPVVNPAFAKSMDRASPAESSRSQSSNPQDEPAISSTPDAETDSEDTASVSVLEEEKRVKVPPMLSSDQQTCLMLALSFLPPQEQYAVRTRLSRLLTHCTGTPAAL